MDYGIGSNYKRNVAMLREGIANGTISALEAKAANANHSCYFTGMPISGTMWELVIRGLMKGFETKDSYYLCDRCYQSSSPNTQRLGQHVDGNFTIN